MKFSIQSRNKKNIKRNPQFEVMRKQRQRRSYSDKISSISLKFQIKKIIFALFLLIVIFAGSKYFLGNSQYLISKIEIYGSSRVSKQSLETYLNKYINKNLVSLSKTELYDDLHQGFLEIGGINLVKIYPNTLKVEVIETLPSIIYFDFDSIELISGEGLGVGSIEFSAAGISSIDQVISATGGNPDADYVRAYLQSKSEGAFKWDEVSSEDRLKVLHLMQEEVRQKVDIYIDSVMSKISETSFKDLLILYRKRFGNDQVPKEIISFSLTMSEFIKAKNLKIRRVNILNIFDLVYELEDNKNIIFSLRRDVNRQVNDLNAILINNQFDTGTTFDLRSSNYSIR